MLQHEKYYVIILIEKSKERKKKNITSKEIRNLNKFPGKNYSNIVLGF